MMSITLYPSEMTLYRDRFDIIASILETAKTRARHTDILRIASISHIPFKQYLLLLHTNGLIEYSSVERTCKTTEKGLHFLDIFGKVKNMLSYNQLSVSSICYVNLELQFRK
jgi:predicted transcriptional regulator